MVLVVVVGSLVGAGGEGDGCGGVVWLLVVWVVTVLMVVVMVTVQVFTVLGRVALVVLWW